MCCYQQAEEKSKQKIWARFFSFNVNCYQAVYEQLQLLSPDVAINEFADLWETLKLIYQHWIKYSFISHMILSMTVSPDVSFGKSQVNPT
jgi:hypothetical protein